jgi:hypothetical protein
MLVDILAGYLRWPVTLRPVVGDLSVVRPFD